MWPVLPANRYIPNGDGTFTPALEAVSTQGVAPDAQLITMKVFGTRGGAYESDYMVAIEDAIVLDCDSVNLSLGSGSPGTSGMPLQVYQAILENLTKAGTVVTMSAGNSGSWVEERQAWQQLSVCHRCEHADQWHAGHLYQLPGCGFNRQCRLHWRVPVRGRACGVLHPELRVYERAVHHHPRRTEIYLH